MIKVGIVGARAQTTLTGFRELENVEVTAVCDLNEDCMNRIADEFQIEHRYRVFDDMLESDIDAVVIATPMQCHVPQAIAALEAGKHVLSEVTADECAAFIRENLAPERLAISIITPARN